MESSIRTYLEVAMASIETSMGMLTEMPGEDPRYADVYCELERAYTNVRRGRKLLR